MATRLGVFKLKWQSPEIAWHVVTLLGFPAESRLKAVGKIENQALLAKIAAEDGDWRVRKAAVQRVTDQALLARIATEAKDAFVREAAAQRMTDQALPAKSATEAKDRDVHEAAAQRVTDRALPARIATEAKDGDVHEAAVSRVTDQALLARIATQHEDWRVREAAVKRVSDQALVARIAIEDEDGHVRKAAMGRVTDQALLARIATQHEDWRVREAAAKRVTDQALLARIATEDEDGHVRKAAVGLVTDQALLARIVTEIKDPLDRIAAVGRLTDQALLARIATEDEDAFVRSAAAKRVPRRDDRKLRSRDPETNKLMNGILLCLHCRQSYRLDCAIAISTDDTMDWLISAGVRMRGSLSRPIRVGHSKGSTDGNSLRHLLDLQRTPGSKWTCHECGSDSIWVQSFCAGELGQRPKQTIQSQTPALGTPKAAPDQARGVSEELNSALIQSLRAGDTECITALIAAGADVNSKTEGSGFPPLMFVASKGDVQGLQAFITAGADVNAVNNEGETALIYAAWNPISGGDEQGNCVKALIAAGADVNVMNIHGETALHRAARAGRTNSVMALIAAGADVNAVDDLGWTPLLDAVVRGENIDCVKALIAAGADVNYKDRHGKTVLMSSSDLDINEALKAAGENFMAIADCPPDVAELVDVFFISGGGADPEQREKSAEKQLKEHPSRATAVPLLTRKYREDRKKNEYQVCKIVEAIGTPDGSFDLLLEIFRDGRKAKVPFDEWGNSKFDYEDYASRPAYLLACKIVNGPARLKERLSRAEYEEAIARAHSWNGSHRPLLAEALAGIGSRLAVLRLLNDILQTGRPQEHRNPSIRALGEIGQQYLPLLIEELEFRRASDRAAQTSYLRDILSVLAICGDKTCVDPIVNVARQDATIVEDARRSLAAISARDRTLKVPEAVCAEPKLVRRLAPTGDHYVDSCFECTWSELDEPRLWSSDPELKAVADLANDGRHAEALAQLAKIWGSYQDYDFVYGWKARMLMGQGHRADAINVLNEGMSKCRTKFKLCANRAEIEYEAGDLGEAVVWWIRSAVSQVSLQGSPVLDAPFMYLAYIAGALHDHASKDRLFKAVDRLTQWGRLRDSAVNRINGVSIPRQSRGL